MDSMKVIFKVERKIFQKDSALEISTGSCLHQSVPQECAVSSRQALFFEGIGNVPRQAKPQRVNTDALLASNGILQY